MTDDQHGRQGQQGQGAPPSGGRWDPLPQGDYDDGATAFVKLPEGGIDALLSGDSPLAAPGHGYVPPQITVAPAGTDAADPTATGTWGMPAGGAEWPEHGAAAAQPAGDDRFTYNPGATGQWTFEESAASAPAPGQDVTGQWSIPVAGGDLPDESGEFTTSSLIDQWGGTPPATLPGGAPAPWATGASGRPWGQESATEQQPGAEYGTGDAGAVGGHAGAYAGEHGVAPGHPGQGAGGAMDTSGALDVSGVLHDAGGTRHDAGGASQDAGGVLHDAGGPLHDASGALHAAGGTLHDVDGALRDAGALYAGEAQHSGEPDQKAAPHGVSEPDEMRAPHGMGEPQHSGVPHPAGDAPQQTGEGHPAGDAPQQTGGGHPEPPYPAPAEPSYEPAPAAVETVQHASGDGEAPGTDESARGPRGAAEEAHAAPATETAASHTDAAAAPTAAPSSADTAHTRVPDAEDAPEGTAPAEDAATEPAETADAADTRADRPDQAAGDIPPPPADEHPLASYVLRVNGSDRPVTDAWIGESLLYVLRERLGLAGAKDGCSQGECGACNVQVDGRLVASCLVPAVTTAGSEVRTVEGLAADGQPSDVQRALARCGAVQCGFCVPGMAMTVHDLLEGNPAPTELETRQALCGNLCRCSGYRGVLEAVREVVAERDAASDDGEQDGDEVRIPQQGGPSLFEAPGAMDMPDQAYGQQPGQGQDGGQA